MGAVVAAVSAYMAVAVDSRSHGSQAVVFNEIE